MSDKSTKSPGSVKLGDVETAVRDLMTEYDPFEGNYSMMVRHLLRLGIAAEREQRRIAAGGSQLDVSVLRGDKGAQGLPEARS